MELLIPFVLTVVALIVLIKNPSWYSRWEIEPWLFKWVLGAVIVVYAVAFVLSFTPLLD